MVFFIALPFGLGSAAILKGGGAIAAAVVGTLWAHAHASNAVASIFLITTAMPSTILATATASLIASGAAQKLTQLVLGVCAGSYGVFLLLIVAVKHAAKDSTVAGGEAFGVSAAEGAE